MPLFSILETIVVQYVENAVKKWSMWHKNPQTLPQKGQVTGNIWNETMSPPIKGLDLTSIASCS